MEIFLSWSKPRSKELAEIFNDWLPNVLQYVNTYMSADPEKLELGERSFTNIRESLEDSSFGLIFVTPENIESPWINFEAGALSKKVDSKVIPIIYDADIILLDKGPLTQFQSAKDLQKESVLDLIMSINNSSGDKKIAEKRLDTIFETWWPDLESKISNVSETKKETIKVQGPTDRELLKEIFNKVSRQDNFIRNQSSQQSPTRMSLAPRAILDIENGYNLLRDYIELNDGEMFNPDTNNILNDFKKAIIYVKRRTIKLKKYSEISPNYNENTLDE